MRGLKSSDPEQDFCEKHRDEADLSFIRDQMFVLLANRKELDNAITKFSNLARQLRKKISSAETSQPTQNAS